MGKRDIPSERVQIFKKKAKPGPKVIYGVQEEFQQPTLLPGQAAGHRTLHRPMGSNTRLSVWDRREIRKPPLYPAEVLVPLQRTCQQTMQKCFEASLARAAATVAL